MFHSNLIRPQGFYMSSGVLDASDCVGFETLGPKLDGEAIHMFSRQCS